MVTLSAAKRPGGDGAMPGRFAALSVTWRALLYCILRHYSAIHSLEVLMDQTVTPPCDQLPAAPSGTGSTMALLYISDDMAADGVARAYAERAAAIWRKRRLMETLDILLREGG
jgi:hypothetical protein